MTSVRYIALCGYPESGKSKVQEILESDFGVEPVDDGAPLREAVKVLYDLTDWHVYTQEGKRCKIRVGETTRTVRQLLGEMGNYLESQDPHFIPKRALAEIAKTDSAGRVYSFGSVRRDQGHVFRETGQALIVEVVRAGCRPAGNWDDYDPNLADIRIENRFDPADPAGSLAALRRDVHTQIGCYFQKKAAAMS